ncbi:MAG: alpha/beta hydrolase, partial [Pseudomonadota bacterium]|nr:alpha/beta hydrolase [Pseudomonadota bacterium]
MDQVNVAGIEMDLEVQGEGPPLLYLHPEHYAHLHAPFLSKLSEDRKVYAARHPGFDGRRPPSDFRRVDDLAYLYLNLLDQLDLSDVMVLGASFGGWIGLEMAVRNTARISNLSLIAPLGVKLGGRDERDFT